MDAREDTLRGGFPAITVGRGRPVVWLGGSTPNHRNPRPGLERSLVLRPLLPYAAAGLAVTMIARWPGMAVGTTFAEVAERHAAAIVDRFGEPVDVVGVSTGGSVLLQLLADRPEVVRRAVVLSSAYALGPLARRVQRDLITGLERTGRYPPPAVVDLFLRPAVPAPVRLLARPAAALATRRVSVDDPGDTIAMLVAEDAFDVRDRLSAIPTPTLVAAGAKDPLWTLDMFAETAYRMPRGRLFLDPHLGHAPVGHPRMRAAVLDFLTAPEP